MNWKTHWLFQNRSRVALIASSAMLLMALITLLSVYATLTADAVSIEARPAAETAAVSPVLTYQGRLLNPTTGAPQNGTHTFTFAIYNVESGGVALWTEIKNVTVSNGLFSTLLGDTTAIPANLFTGQNLWLGIKVGADAEATPRQRLAPVAYAMYSDNADRLDGLDSTYFRNATNINAGTLADARIPAAITRDNEVMSIVTANGGTGSGLDADLLDGKDSTDFAAASHTHNGSDITAGSIGTTQLANNAVTASKIATGAVGDAQIADRTRTLSFPASALSFDPASTVIKAVFNGLDWQRNFASPAYLIISRPDDWDGTSNVSFTIHFYPTTNSAGNVDFFIRPRAYSVGATFADASSLNATPVAAAGTSVINKQTFSISASSFSTRELWVIAIQNQGSGSTYPDAVRVMSVSLSYTAVR
ncbi:MAG: hypothetical protein KF893_01515 [Caldilineaceae bacterium]|nr:hypothetical protein [Caldilineaceae bacterium]